MGKNISNIINDNGFHRNLDTLHINKSKKKKQFFKLAIFFKRKQIKRVLDKNITASFREKY